MYSRPVAFAFWCNAATQAATCTGWHLPMGPLLRKNSTRFHLNLLASRASAGVVAQQRVARSCSSTAPMSGPNPWRCAELGVLYSLTWLTLCLVVGHRLAGTIRGRRVLVTRTALEPSRLVPSGASTLSHVTITARRKTLSVQIPRCAPE